jgi:hypothetical protein
MMNSKRLPLWLGGIGSLLLVPGILWVAGSKSRLSDEDARVALQPLKRIQLAGIDRGPLSVTLMIPDTAQWTKIRKGWGEPDLVISAVEPAGSFALCLPEVPVRIVLIDAAGRLIPLQPGGAPYGYSTSCPSSSLRFHADPGSELTLKLVGHGTGTVPAAELIVKNDWFNTKDKLVGLALVKDIESLVKWLSIAGFLLVASGVGVFFVNRIRHHAFN